MAITKIVDNNCVKVKVDGVVIKEFSLYDDYAFTKANDMIKNLRANPSRAKKLKEENK